MGITTTISLLTIAVVLFLATRRGWFSNETLQTVANIATIVALLAAVAVFIIPTPQSQGPLPRENPPTSIIIAGTIPDVPTVTPSQTTPLLSGSASDWLPSAGDIPDEMIRVENRSYSNEEIAQLYPDQPDLLSKLQQWGRLNNSFQIYQDIDKCDSKIGLQKMGLQAILYKTLDGASQGINQTKTQWGYQSDSIEIGDKSFVLWYDETNDCTPPDNLRTVSILFQRYNVVANVDVGAVKGNLNEDDLKSFAIELARKIDDKLLAEAR